ncbi:MAG: TonB-dependent receptor [Bacteroidales bacterium]|nr:TonB-dependent receptor [Bacteroidales bacterium]
MPSTNFTNRYFRHDKLGVALGYQLNDSKEFKHFIDKYGVRSQDYLHYRDMGYYDLGLFQHTLSGNVIYSLGRFSNQTIKTGINTQYQHHTTDGYGHILPAYRRFTAGFFLTHQYKLSDKWIINSGARVDHTFFEMQESLNAEFPVNQLDSLFNPDFKTTYPGSAFSLGFNYLPGAKTTIKVHAGKSFRVPSAYELGAYGLHTHAGRFEKGDLGNKPEKAWQFNIGLEQKWTQLSFSISPFLNLFTNYLFLKPTSDFAPGGAGQIYQYEQSKALLYGGEASIEYPFSNKILIKAGAEYVYAVNLDLRSALPFTPPFNLQTEASYLFKDTKWLKKNKIGVELVSIAQQKYTEPNELTTPGYNAINLLVLTELAFGSQKLSLMLKVRNLFNRAYYNHISFYRRMRIPEPGRDVQLFISIPIE